MFGFELTFMTGAWLLSLLNLASIVLIGFALYMIARTITKKDDYDESSYLQLMATYVFLLGLGIITSSLFGSATAPKTRISVEQNEHLIEYQQNREEVVIETPAARTETLEGFSPLGE